MTDGEGISILALFVIFFLAGIFVAECKMHDNYEMSCRKQCDMGGQIYHSMDTTQGCLCVDASGVQRPQKKPGRQQ